MKGYSIIFVLDKRLLIIDELKKSLRFCFGHTNSVVHIVNFVIRFIPGKNLIGIAHFISY